MSSGSSGGALAHAKAIGHDVEELVVDAIDAIDAFDLEYGTDAHHDAVVTEPVSSDVKAAGGVPVVFVGLVALEVDQLVEVKACVRSASNGDATTPGRWLFKGPDEGQHGALVDEGAVYALEVYGEDGASRELLTVAIVPADVVYELIADSSKNFAQLCKDSKCNPSMIVTSPPYCNAIEYSRRHRLEYEWLGLFNHNVNRNARQERIEESRRFFGSVTAKQGTLRSLDEVPLKEVRNLTAGIEGDGYERKVNLLRKYFLDAFDWIEEVYDALPADGLFCLIIGPSTSYGRTVDTPSYLRKIAERQGFVVESEHSYKLINNKMQYPTNGATTDTETLFEFRKT